ncbi:c-type cytochrome [Puniceibacterium sediminis]|uniref:Sulfur dehydrogenase subunit SoxD n=1 Tax=Puniceibacterium sediminis TaxID=1608407 RepID=A0A238V2J2_9RHOB|nr:c-type cytochrome [Puniceibacterium sediminis]SNR27803.1 sulfur dehydrogenase subunit SoxD [Puniceibacterium sediminis]
MSKYPETLCAVIVSALIAGPAVAGPFGLGRVAEPDEIAAWNLDVSPDGTGLPDGSGSVADGEQIFSDNCASCHGEFAEGLGNWPKLAGGDGTLANVDPVKTVGSYWPYLSTTWDYVNRSMPFGNAQSLSADDVYAITAYILYSNFLVDDDFVLSRENFTEVEMPNVGGFIPDDRPESEYAHWRVEPCMTDCKGVVEITMKATVLDVTPQESTDTAEPAESSAATAQAEAVPVEQAAEPAPVAEPVLAAFDPDLAAAGEKVFRKCRACHEVGADAKNKVGPQLHAIVGRTVGSVDGFKYSKAMASDGGTWSEEYLAAFLANPKKAMKGTKMSFAGLKKDSDIAAVTEYLKSVVE